MDGQGEIVSTTNSGDTGISTFSGSSCDGSRIIVELAEYDPTIVPDEVIQIFTDNYPVRCELECPCCSSDDDAEFKVSQISSDSNGSCTYEVFAHAASEGCDFDVLIGGTLIPLSDEPLERKLTLCDEESFAVLLLHGEECQSEKMTCSCCSGIYSTLLESVSNSEGCCIHYVRLVNDSSCSQRIFDHNNTV